VQPKVSVQTGDSLPSGEVSQETRSPDSIVDPLLGSNQSPTAISSVVSNDEVVSSDDVIGSDETIAADGASLASEREDRRDDESAVTATAETSDSPTPRSESRRPGDKDSESEINTPSEPSNEIDIQPIPKNRLLTAPGDGENETEEILDAFVGPDQKVRDTMVPPPLAQPLGRDNHLWINRKNSMVIADGYVAMRRGVLEMFACPMGTKEHESVVATLAQSKEVHAALLAVGAEPGTPVQFVPKFIPATGQVIRVWVCWRDADDQFHSVDARTWVQKMGDKQAMKAEWIFAGSGFWKDPSDGRDYYQADGGDMICVSNFSTAMMDISIASSAESDHLMYEPATDKVPERGTPVRLVLIPIPNPADLADPKEAKRLAEEIESKKTTPPGESILPPLRKVKSPGGAKPDDAS
tara:strand:- start:463038 stop:464270 length:1233 start_codon:yes stop_codon:yes gene_type:complete